jgi:4'-phosphopantetheinyl transferase
MGQDLSAVHKNLDIWTIDLTRGADGAALSADEQARAARLLMPDARRRFVASRARLREILAQITGIDAAALTFGTGEHGKPYLSGVDDAPQFNLAHSGDLALVAVSDRPVGVDLEQVRPLANMAQMADMSFTDEERAVLWSLDEAARTAAFFRLWTRKEAVMKAHGAGFRLAKTFSVPLAQTDAASVTLEQKAFSMRDLDIPDNFAAAVAVETDSAIPIILLVDTHHLR